MTNGIRQLASGTERPLVDSVNVYVDGGFVNAVDGYGAFLTALRREGYDVGVDVEHDVLEIEPAGGSERPALPPSARATVRSLAAELRRAVLAHTPDDDELAALEQRYRERLVDWLGRLEFRGMMSAARAIVLPLEDVYVELRAVAEVPAEADAFSVDERRLLLDLEEKEGKGQDGERHRDLMDQCESLRHERWSQTLTERRSIAEALHRGDQRAFVVLGDPGSGKTTLLHYLTLIYARGAERAAERLGIPQTEADRLPIFLPLAAFDDMLHKRPDLTLKDFLFLYYDTRRGLPGLKPLFHRALASGRALVLFDGLDEVLDVSTRHFVADQVAALMGELTPRGVRFVLASRVVGYHAARVPGRIATLTVVDFGEREIEVFVRQWARAFEVSAAGGESPEVLQKAYTLEKDLMDDVRANASVRKLAANPLMLTMLALLRRQVGRLPHRRIELYQRYVTTLLVNWIETRSFGARTESVERLDRHQAENVLIPLALWLQKERPSGTARRHDVRRRLTDIYLEEEGLTPGEAKRPQLRQAEARADRFLHEMQQMAGLLVERGHDAYGFLHLTFQEYFAGRALARLGAEARWQVVRRHLHDPRWREPIMLCAGWLGVVENRRQEVTDLTRLIFEREDPSEEDLHRNLLLALAIACDDPNLEPRLVGKLVTAAVGCLPARIPTLGKEITKSLAQLVANGSADIAACFAPIWKSDDWHVRQEAVKILGHFGTHPQVRATLRERLSHEDGWVHQAALNALANQIDTDSTIKWMLFEALNCRFSSDRKAAVEALSGQAANPSVRDALLERVDDSWSPVRVAAVKALSDHTADPSVRDALLERTGDFSFSVADAAIAGLASQIGTDSAVRNTLLEKLNDGTASAAIAFSRQAEADPAVRSILLRKLDEEENWYFRCMALTALAGTIREDAGVRSVMVDSLSDEHGGIRWTAAKALAREAHADPFIRDALLKKIYGVDQGTRSVAMEALADQFSEDANIQSAFMERSRNVDWRIRALVAGAIGKRCIQARGITLLREIQRETSTPEALEYLVAALGCLAPFAPSSKRIKNRIFECLNDEEWRARKAAVDALSDCVDSDLEVRNALIKKLDDDNEGIRSAAARALESLVVDDPEIRRVLIGKLNSEDESMLLAVMKSLSPLANVDAVVREMFLERMNDEKKSGEHSLFVRRTPRAPPSGEVARTS
ncbi:MAG: NACHT domain-containing protein, partial [bacterium]|nr:NACHT domain-containing protein [bacterium]